MTKAAKDGDMIQLEFVGPMDIATALPTRNGHYAFVHWCPNDEAISISFMEFHTKRGWRDHIPMPDYIVQGISTSMGGEGGALPSILSAPSNPAVRESPILSSVLGATDWHPAKQLQAVAKKFAGADHVNAWYGLSEKSAKLAATMTEGEAAARFTKAVREQLIAVARAHVRKVTGRDDLWFSPELDPEHPRHEEVVGAVIGQAKKDMIPERLTLIKAGFGDDEKITERTIH